MALTFAPILAATAAPDSAGDRPLSEYRDKNRVLLVFAANSKDPAYLEQRRLWQDERAGFDDRQLVLVPVLGDAGKSAGEPPATLARRFRVDPGSFAVVLLGKDGHDAYRSPKPVPAATIYETIDVMPMRRAEIKHPATSRAPTPTTQPMQQAQPDTDHDE